MYDYFVMPSLEYYLESYGNLPSESGSGTWDDMLRAYLELE